MDEERAGGTCLIEERLVLGVGVEHLVHLLGHTSCGAGATGTRTGILAPIVRRSRRDEPRRVARRSVARGVMCYPRAAPSPRRPGRAECRSKKFARCSGSMTA